MQWGLDSRFLAFCSAAPAQKWSVPSSQIAGSGVTCGRPSRRTVDSQNISDLDSTSTTSAHGGAVASGSLNPSCNSTVGSISGISALPFAGSMRSLTTNRQRPEVKLIAPRRRPEGNPPGCQLLK